MPERAVCEGVAAWTGGGAERWRRRAAAQPARPRSCAAPASRQRRGAAALDRSVREPRRRGHHIVFMGAGSVRGRRRRRRRTWWYRWRCQARPRGRDESPTRLRAAAVWDFSAASKRCACARRTAAAAAHCLHLRARARGLRPGCRRHQLRRTASMWPLPMSISLFGRQRAAACSVVPLWASTDRATVRGCAAAAPAAGYACDVLLFVHGTTGDATSRSAHRCAAAVGCRYRRDGYCDPTQVRPPPPARPPPLLHCRCRPTCPGDG